MNIPNHFIYRTSPYGEDFYGTCRLCGQENLPGEAALLECPNPNGTSVEEAFLDVLETPKAIL